MDGVLLPAADVAEHHPLRDVHALVNEERRRAPWTSGIGCERGRGGRAAGRPGLEGRGLQSVRRRPSTIWNCASALARDLPVPAGRCAVRLPVVLPEGVRAVRLEDADGNPIPAALTEVAPLPGGWTRAEVRFVAPVGPGTTARYRLRAAPAPAPGGLPPVTRLANRWLEVSFSPEDGIASLRYLGVEMGGSDFLRPFVSYRTHRRPVVYPAGRYTFVPLEGEVWEGLQRVRMRTTIPMQTPHGRCESELTCTFTLFDDLPYLYVDVEVDYAYTPPTATLHTVMQKLRRLADLRWVEVAPSRLRYAWRRPPDGRCGSGNTTTWELRHTMI